MPIKNLILACAVAFSGVAWGQTVDVKDLDTQGEGTTTIEIKKNKKEEEKKAEAKWEITEGNADVEGEPAATAKDARAEWTKACNNWKKEFRADNKENKILAINCGSAACGGDAGSKTCTSKASYKIKTRID